MKILQLVCLRHPFSLTHPFPSLSLFSQDSPQGTPVLDVVGGVKLP